MDEGQLVGVLTEEDIISYVFRRPELLGHRVREAMQTGFIRLERAASVDNLVALLHHAPYAAITDGDEFLGLITRSDVLNHLRKQLPGGRP
jgi:cystathionine beta-synthase